MAGGKKPSEFLMICLFSDAAAPGKDLNTIYPEADRLVIQLSFFYAVNNDEFFTRARVRR